MYQCIRPYSVRQILSDKVFQRFFQPAIIGSVRPIFPTPNFPMASESFTQTISLLELYSGQLSPAVVYHNQLILKIG